jgi:hypothetical protein
MNTYRRCVAGLLTITVLSITPSTTADEARGMSAVFHPDAAHVRGGDSAASPNLDDPTREEKTIALLILLLKQGRGMR